MVAAFTLCSVGIFVQDRDNNPHGAKGGPETNWENKPWPQGGPGARPN